jgi:hypothetical protein
MALSEFEIKRSQKIMDEFLERRRPPAYMREELDLGYRIQGQSIEIFEIRPYWRDSQKKIEQAVAKATYVKQKGLWKVFWQRADLKWHPYDSEPEAATLEEFLDIVNEDEFDCFFN